MGWTTPMSSVTKRILMTILLVLTEPLFCSTQSSSSEPYFISIKISNSSRTVPLSINNQLTVTGFFEDPQNNSHAFVRDVFGKIAAFDVEGMPTIPAAINNSGQITGGYTKASGQEAGFIRSAKGGIETFNPGGGAGVTVPTAINDSGMVTGYYSSLDNS